MGQKFIGYNYHYFGRNRTMPEFENICKDKHIDSHRNFSNRMMGLPNQCVGFSEEDYQKLRELKAEDISLLEIKAFADSQNTVCAHQKKEQEFATNHQSGFNDEIVLSKVLLEGSVKNSAFVLEIQDRLRNLGYLVGGVDGNYAEMLRDKSMGQTAEAIFRFQKDHNISPTGKMDVLTYTALSLASPKTTFGLLAGAFESPTKGMESIGWDENGGTSYGRFQFSSRSGVMDSFVKYLRTCDAKANSLADKLEGSTFAKNRKDMHTERLYEKAKKDIEEGEIGYKKFRVAQKEYDKKHYLNQYDAGKYVASHAEGTPIEVWVALFRELEPYVEKFVESKYYTNPMITARREYPKLMGLWNTIDNSRSLREVFLSMSIQHGQSNVVSHFVKIYHNSGGDDDDNNNKSIDETTLIHSVYNYRKTNFPRFTKRYEREQLLAIDMLRLETETKQCSAERD